VPHPGGQGGNQPRHGSSLAPGLSRGWTPVYAEWHGDATRGDLLSRNAMRGGRTWLEELGKVSEQLSIEPSPVEAQRVAAQQLRIERLSLLLKGLHRRDQAIDLLLGKPHAGRRISAVQVRDRFRRAALAVGDDGCAASVGLDGDDAEILFAGKDQGTAAAQVVANRFVWSPAEEVQGSPGHRPHARFVLGGADDEEA